MRWLLGEVTLPVFGASICQVITRRHLAPNRCPAGTFPAGTQTPRWVEGEGSAVLPVFLFSPTVHLWWKELNVQLPICKRARGIPSSDRKEQSTAIPEIEFTLTIPLSVAVLWRKNFMPLVWLSHASQSQYDLVHCLKCLSAPWRLIIWIPFPTLFRQLIFAFLLAKTLLHCVEEEKGIRTIWELKGKSSRITWHPRKTLGGDALVLFLHALI